MARATRGYGDADDGDVTRELALRAKVALARARGYWLRDEWQRLYAPSEVDAMLDDGGGDRVTRDVSPRQRALHLLWTEVDPAEVIAGARAAWVKAKKDYRYVAARAQQPGGRFRSAAGPASVDDDQLAILCARELTARRELLRLLEMLRRG